MPGGASQGAFLRGDVGHVKRMTFPAEAGGWGDIPSRCVLLSLGEDTGSFHVLFLLVP